MKQKKIIFNAFYGFLVGLIIPIAGILIELFRTRTRVTFLTIWQLHVDQPLLWLMEMTPLVFALFAMHLGNQSKKLEESFEQLNRNIKEQTEKVQNEHFFLEALITGAPFAVVRLDVNHRIVSFNPAFEALFGYHGSEIIGRQLDDLITSNEYHKEATELSQKVSSGKMVSALSQRKRKDGSLIDVEVVGIPVLEDEENIGILGLYQDISSKKEAERALQESEERYKCLFDDSPISLWEEDFSEVKKLLDEYSHSENIIERLIHDDDLINDCVRLVKILDVNQATLNLFNVNAKSEFIASLSQVLVDDSLNQFRNELLALLSGKISYECEIVQKKQGGELMFGLLRLSLGPGFEDTWGRVIISILDITHRKHIEEKLRFYSYHDALTGVYNQAFFNEEMERLKLSRHFPACIIICDMDNLKNINDTLGHEIGDRAIKAAAKILTKGVFRKEDMVARVGGDEFAIILPNSNYSSIPSILSRLEQSIKDHNESKEDDGLYRPISISYGFAEIPQGGSLIDGYKRADKRMYKNKIEKKLLLSR